MVENNKTSVPPLTRENIHLWWNEFQSAKTDPLQWSLLDAEERSRAQRFRRECDRDRFVQVRSTLRHLMAAYLSISATEVKFCYGCKGKPTLDASLDDPIEFNVSHSHNFALWGFSRHHVIGVDIEYIQPDFQAEPIAQRFFTAREFQALKTQPEIQQHQFFFQLWTRKEACIKAKGDSLFEQISQLEVPDNPRCTSRWVRLNQRALAVRDLDLHPHYRAAIATEAKDPQLFCLRADTQSIFN
jgi:4'-phosphopantetheinyl transferase